MPRSPLFLLSLLALTAWAGDIPSTAPAPRREFRQRKTYPYIFEPVSYLGNGAPPAMRTTQVTVEPARPNPPQVPRPTPQPTPSATPTPSPTPAPEPPKPQPTPEPTPGLPADGATPAFPPPGNAQPVTRQDALDMTKYPAEVVDIFKNPYNVPKSRKNFFDPVFEPAQPPTSAQPQPSPSKAAFRQE